MMLKPQTLSILHVAHNELHLQIPPPYAPQHVHSSHGGLRAVEPAAAIPRSLSFKGTIKEELSDISLWALCL